MPPLLLGGQARSVRWAAADRSFTACPVLAGPYRVRPRPFPLTRDGIAACLVLSLLLPLVGVAGTWALPIGRTAHVTVDGHTLTYTSIYPTVGDVLAAGRIRLHPGDRVVPDPGTFLWPGIQISVIRAVRVMLAAGGTVRENRVAARSVGEALQALGTSLGPLDRVYPDPGTDVAPDMRITVERREWRTWVERRVLPFTSQTIKDGGLSKGDQVVRSPGREGAEERTIRALYADGHPTAVVPQAWSVVQHPSPRVIAIGTRPVLAVGGQFAGREFMVMEATAYYPGPNNYGGGVGPRTATGALAQRGVVAVDPSVIPLGTRVYVEGYGYAIAADTGGAIQGNRIDLCYDTYEEAIQFGRRPVKVYILAKR